MVQKNEVDDMSKKFLLQMYRHVNADVSLKASMYDIGSEAGLEKDDVLSVAQYLVGTGMLELVSLSGEISITEKGIANLVELQMINESSDKPAEFIGETYCIDKDVRNTVETLTARIKCVLSGSDIDYDLLEELVADLKTIDAQLFSPRPKTQIIIDCFQSIRTVIEKTGEKDILCQINRVLGQ